MGGLGALTYAARHPDLYAAVASFSGIAHTCLYPGSTHRTTSGWWSPRARIRSPCGATPDRDVEVWRQHNPYDLAPKLRGTALFVSVGTGRPGPLDGPTASSSATEASLATENVALARRLRSLGIPARFDFYGPGTHTWPYWQRELHRAWPMFRQALGLR